MPGEQEVLQGTRVHRWPLAAASSFDLDAAAYHFRTAESHFYRLGFAGGMHVSKVEYLVNPPLVKKFIDKRLSLAEKMDWEETRPIMCFHGTSAANIESIVEHNFDLRRVGSSTDTGFFGRGVYFSETSSYSVGYARGGTSILLCQVLLGRCFQVAKVQTGRNLEPGYDSHVSPCGNEIVIFDNAQILPAYIVHFEHGAAKPIAPTKASKAPGAKRARRGWL
eukprot:TRINITY_DN1713_c0_g2_i1.p2 TRINITY_DN1713_c0_g2~~TRINITY_DN1713_c0_g2_i1.p2  ORF type:complete len:222 (-),score=65.95 TRINITY_DN1713_c0_g2_i1:52-717(-)